MGKILAFSGSNSSTSINQRFIHAVSSLITDNEVEVIDLRDYSAPLFSVDLESSEGYPDTIYALLDKIHEADGFLISTPEHNKSIPAFFKNTIDWVSRIQSKFFEHKPVALLSVSDGKRAAKLACDHLAAILPYRGAEIVGTYNLGLFYEHLINGKIDPEILEQVRPLIHTLEVAVEVSISKNET